METTSIKGNVTSRWKGTGSRLRWRVGLQGSSTWRPHHILTAAAICMLHPASAPHELMAHAVPGMVAIACALGPHSLLAASMLAEGVLNPALARWQSYLGDLRALTNKYVCGYPVALQSSTLLQRA